MITIPRYAQGQKTSLAFAMVIVSIAISKGYPWKGAGLSSWPEDDAELLNGVGDWLVDRDPQNFERGD